MHPSFAIAEIASRVEGRRCGLKINFTLISLVSLNAPNAAPVLARSKKELIVKVDLDQREGCSKGDFTQFDANEGFPLHREFIVR